MVMSCAAERAAPRAVRNVRNRPAARRRAVSRRLAEAALALSCFLCAGALLAGTATAGGVPSPATSSGAGSTAERAADRDSAGEWIFGVSALGTVVALASAAGRPGRAHRRIIRRFRADLDGLDPAELARAAFRIRQEGAAGKPPP